MTDETARFQLPLLTAGQAQKEIAHNEALLRLDALASPTVEGAPIAIPPADPMAGQSWIVAAGGGGAWSGQDGAIAQWTSSGWRFVAPVEGMLAWRRDAGHWLVRVDGAWQDDAFPVPALSVAGTKVVGPQQPAIAAPDGGAVVDAEARGAISAVLAALRAHGLLASV